MLARAQPEVSAMIDNPIPWPSGARCAVAITFDMDADSILHLGYHDTADTRMALLSALRYGPEIAVPRLVALYREFGIRQTFFVPAWCVERYPRAVELILAGGHEIGHHGYIHEHPNELAPDEELDRLRHSAAILAAATGARPRGYRAPTYRFSRHTADFLIQEGFDYDSSLFGDDIPYVLRTKAGQVIEIPSHYGMDDWPQYQISREFDYFAAVKAPRRAIEVYIDEFEAAWEFGGLWNSVWHPFLSGRLARARAIRDLIRHMVDKGDVWFARLDEIADHVREVTESGAWTPRVDDLPYYDGPIAELGRAVAARVKPA